MAMMTATTGVKVTIVDYGASNIKSIVRGLERAGAAVTVAGSADGLRGAAGLVIPGVGAAGASMRGLRERGLVAPLLEAVAAGTPLLGVCMGMQLLCGPQEEDAATGLGLLPGRVRRLHTAKVPHMGWNAVEAVPGNEGPLTGLPRGSYAYFVHSYYIDLEPDDEGIVAGVADYDGRFIAAVARGNIWGTQFHPEKSGSVGTHVLRNFVALAAGVPLPTPGYDAASGLATAASPVLTAHTAATAASGPEAV